MKGTPSTSRQHGRLVAYLSPFRDYLTAIRTPPTSTRNCECYIRKREDISFRGERILLLVLDYVSSFVITAHQRSLTDSI